MIRNILAKIFLRTPKNITYNYSSWNEAHYRLLPEVRPKVTSSFKIEKNDKIFTIGSCFAREIEDDLAALGFTIPMKMFSAPKIEWPKLKRPNGMLNKFSPASIFQELQWCDRIFMNGGIVDIKSAEKYFYFCDDRRVIDMHIGGYVPVSLERAIERRQEIFNVVSQVFTSNVVVMTLGLVEAWFDTKNELFILRAPSDEMKGDQKRFTFVLMHYNDCYRYVENTISLLRKYNPKCKFLITTSPIPLKKTFTDIDVIVANTYSKSVLRAVCGEIVDTYEGVDYFPAYENISLQKDWRAFDRDLRGIRKKSVRKIVEWMIGHYC